MPQPMNIGISLVDGFTRVPGYGKVLAVLELHSMNIPQLH